LLCDPAHTPRQGTGSLLHLCPGPLNPGGLATPGTSCFQPQLGPINTISSANTCGPDSVLPGYISKLCASFSGRMAGCSVGPACELVSESAGWRTGL